MSEDMQAGMSSWVQCKCWTWSQIMQNTGRPQANTHEQEFNFILNNSQYFIICLQMVTYEHT